MTSAQTNSADAAYNAAASALQAGRLDEAARALAPFISRGFPDARLYGLAGFVRLRAGDPAGALEVLPRARQLHPQEPVYALAHGDALFALNRPNEAQLAYRAALAIDPRRTPAVVGLAKCMITMGLQDEALTMLTGRIASGDIDHSLMITCAELQSQMGLADASIDTWRRAVVAHQQSAVARHNLAAAYGDAYRYAEAEEAARAALRMGANGPQTWLVLARALQGLGRMEDAEQAFREVLKQAPHSSEAHRDLTQLVWMRTGDVALAGDALRKAMVAYPDIPELVITLAKLHQFGGDLPGGRAILDKAIARGDWHPSVFLVAGDMALADGDPQAALELTRRGLELAPGEHRALVSVCDAYLGIGDAAQAAAIAEKLVAQDPDDVIALARLATAWRMLGDPRYETLYNYADYVRPYQIDTPEGWPDLTSYLADLSKALVAAHGFATHPFDQSLRHGSQTSQNLELSDDPAIKAFFKAIDGPIRKHMEHLRSYPEGLGRRYLGDYTLSGVWSVFLRPTGFHVDHIHPMGWLSSAFYVEVPTSPADDPTAGWIKFGEPGNPTTPKLAAEHFVQPQPGTLVLFPSYMWHGTVPFASDERRLTMAFDIRPVAPKP